MPPYRKPGSVSWKETKYDECTIAPSGKPYRHQKGSGRADCLQHITDGMKVKDLTMICAQNGYDAEFVVGSILKQMGVDDHAFDLVPPEGVTLEQLRAQRKRTVTPEQEQAAAEKRAAKEAAKAERAKAAEAKRLAKEQERAEAAAAKEREQAAAPKKGKGKAKASPAPEAAAEQETAATA